jgi:4-amino-4-deoxy-L-arabinose transferase-like glycosyltransferase
MCHSPAFDEVGHMPAGLKHWQKGRFDLYRVNPPLVRLVATLPVLAYRPTIDWNQSTEQIWGTGRPEFGIGTHFITENGERSFWYFTVARWACIPFSLLGGWVCWLWASQLFGNAAGLLALTLWCFCPIVLGNAQMITPDTGAAALGLTAHYVFWRWLKTPSWGWARLAGFTLGLAELTKVTWIILFPLWPAIWLAWCWPRLDLDGRSFRRQAGQLALILVLALFVLNAAYTFDGSFQPLKKYIFYSQSLGGRWNRDITDLPPQNRFRGTLLGDIPVPLPRMYVLGIDMQKRDFEVGFDSYLRGEWKRGGWWYYYLYGLGVKVPLGTWLLVLLAIGLAWARPDCRASRRDELFLLTPVVVILTMVSSQTGFNHHLRYVLPIFPFAFILISRVGRLAAPADRGSSTDVVSVEPRPAHADRGTVWLRLTAGAALTWSVAASLAVFPHSMSYFNELVGGPTRGGEHLVDSNLDWGQDLLYLRDWLREHPEARPLGLGYFGAFDPHDAGIDFTLPPLGPNPDADVPQDPDECGPKPGWYAISATLLAGYSFPLRDQDQWVPHAGPGLRYFQRFEPVARAGYSINIYHVTLQQANEVRRELGLPPLPETSARESSPTAQGFAPGGSR